MIPANYEFFQALEFDFRRAERKLSTRERALVEKYEVTNLNKSQIFFLPPWLPDHEVAAIIGDSGSGKTTLAIAMGYTPPKPLEPHLSALEQFESNEIAEKKLGAMGFRSIPSYLTLVENLSVGERWRVEVAHSLGSGVLLDEFSSSIDRQLAKNLSITLKKSIKQNKYKNICIVSCHDDFLEELSPDFIISTKTREIYQKKGEPQSQTLEAKIRPCSRDEWSFFLRITT